MSHPGSEGLNRVHNTGERRFDSGGARRTHGVVSVCVIVANRLAAFSA